MSTSCEAYSAGHDGFEVVPCAAEAQHLDAIRGHVESIEQLDGEVRAGRRNLLGDAFLFNLAQGELRRLAASVIGPNARPVRMIYFNKSSGSNWGVPWHQDLNIAVRGVTHPPGFGPWTTKRGVTHVVPPCNILEAMITVRLHLDDCTLHNGCLRVIPGSHALGKLSAADRDHLVASADVVDCTLAAGDALLMRPLLLHSSRKVAGESRRRVIHAEYAACELGGGLEWYFASLFPQGG